MISAEQPEVQIEIHLPVKAQNLFGLLFGTRRRLGVPRQRRAPAGRAKTVHIATDEHNVVVVLPVK
jgi:hypothetical protein